MKTSENTDESLSVTDEIERALASDAVSRDETWKLVERFHAQNESVTPLFTRRLKQIVVVWAVTLGVKGSIIGEGQIGSFTLKDLSAVILVSPLLIAILYHDALTAQLLAFVTRRWIQRCYRKLLPDVPVAAIEALLMSPRLHDVEALVLLRKGVPPLVEVTSALVLAIMLFGPALLLLHSCYFVAQLPNVSVVIRVIIIAISAILAVRGWIASLVMRKYT